MLKERKEANSFLLLEKGRKENLHPFQESAVFQCKSLLKTVYATERTSWTVNAPLSLLDSCSRSRGSDSKRKTKEHLRKDSHEEVREEREKVRDGETKGPQDVRKLLLGSHSSGKCKS